MVASEGGGASVETKGALKTSRSGVVLSVIFFLVHLLAQTASAQPTSTNTFSEMLKLIPTSPQTRQEVIIHDYARIRQMYTIPQPAAEASATDQQAYVKAIASALPGTDPAFKAAAFLSGFQYAVPTPIRRENMGFGVQDVDADIQTGLPPQVFEAIRGRIDPAAIEDALKRCSSCPIPVRDTYEGCKTYDWRRDPVVGSLKLRFTPPAFDNVGRLRPLGVQKSYVFRAPALEDIQRMCATSRGKHLSLADETDFRVIAQGMSALGAYSVVLLDKPNQHLEAPTKPLLRCYQAAGWGIGKDEQGQYLALMLVHTEEQTARENVRLLRRRIAETSIPEPKTSWKELVDSIDIRTEGRALLATLRSRANLNLVEWNTYSLLQCE
jgi:hypothetical protein